MTSKQLKRLSIIAKTIEKWSRDKTSKTKRKARRVKRLTTSRKLLTAKKLRLRKRSQMPWVEALAKVLISKRVEATNLMHFSRI